jgi:hypothetical protein
MSGEFHLTFFGLCINFKRKCRWRSSKFPLVKSFSKNKKMDAEYVQISTRNDDFILGTISLSWKKKIICIFTSPNFHLTGMLLIKLSEDQVWESKEREKIINKTEENFFFNFHAAAVNVLIRGYISNTERVTNLTFQSWIMLKMHKVLIWMVYCVYSKSQFYLKSSFAKWTNSILILTVLYLPI